MSPIGLAAAALLVAIPLFPMLGRLLMGMARKQTEAIGATAGRRSAPSWGDVHALPTTMGPGPAADRAIRRRQAGPALGALIDDDGFTAVRVHALAECLPRHGPGSRRS